MMTGSRPRISEGWRRWALLHLVLLLALVFPPSGLGQGSEWVGLTAEGGMLVATGQPHLAGGYGRGLGALKLRRQVSGADATGRDRP
jgi:hypothetical protein